MPANEFSSADERMASLRAHQARRNQPGLSPSIEAALRIAQSYARGGGIAPGLPMAPFQPIAAPSTVMPRIAAGHMPRILPMTRGHFADGGSTLPSHVLHALAIVQDHVRKHYDDGGTIDGQFGSASTGNMQLGGLQLGGGPGPGINSGSSGVANWQPPVLTPINNSGSLGSVSFNPACRDGGRHWIRAALCASDAASSSGARWLDPSSIRLARAGAGRSASRSFRRWRRRWKWWQRERERRWKWQRQ